MVRRKIVDVEKFKEMYASGVPVEEIAKFFGVTKEYVKVKAQLLGVRRGFRPTKGVYPPWLKKWRIEQRKKKIGQAIKILEENGGYCPIRLLQKEVGVRVVKELLFRRIMFRVEFVLGHVQGSYKRGMQHKIFRPEFYRRTYICLGRTGVVRLMMKALLPPEDSHVQKSLSSFLRKYLTEAERVAVLFHLGVRDWRRNRLRKKTIRIDGIYVPRVFNLSRDERLRLKYPFEVWCWKTQRQVRVSGEIRHFSAHGLQVLKIRSCIHKASCGSADTTECLIGKELQSVWVKQ